MAKVVLFDSTLCSGCKACEAACAERWGLPYDDTIAKEEKLSAHKLTVVETRGGRNVRRMCMHCAEPTCVSVCPVGALKKTALGPVVYNADRCMGCRYCMLACPFHAPTYEWSSRVPRVTKCDMCFERQSAGKPTACAEACGFGATIVGERDEMIAEAFRRFEKEPGKYYPRIYGRREVGGTSVLILSAVPFEQLGLPAALPQEPLPMLTWNVLTHVPDVVTMGSVLLGGVYWLTHRREEVATAEGDRNGRKRRRP